MRLGRATGHYGHERLRSAPSRPFGKGSVDLGVDNSALPADFRMADFVACPPTVTHHRDLVCHSAVHLVRTRVIQASLAEIIALEHIYPCEDGLKAVHVESLDYGYRRPAPSADAPMTMATTGDTGLDVPHPCNRRGMMADHRADGRDHRAAWPTATALLPMGKRHDYGLAPRRG